MPPRNPRDSREFKSSQGARDLELSLRQARELDRRSQLEKTEDALARYRRAASNYRENSVQIKLFEDVVKAPADEGAHNGYKRPGDKRRPLLSSKPQSHSMDRTAAPLGAIEYVVNRPNSYLLEQ